MSDESLASPLSKDSSNGTPAQTPCPTTEPPPPHSRPSSSRALVPTPITTNITPKAVATASSPTNPYASASPIGGGPTSTSYVVPPRPKPGRKPATDEPASKRKAQNRESQRAFRARKAAKVNELQQQVESTEERHRKEVSDKISQLNEKDIEIRELKAQMTQSQENEKRKSQECEWWKERAGHFEAQNSQLLQQLKARGGSIGPFANAPFFPATFPTSRQDSPRGSISSFGAYNSPIGSIGCGKCKANGECECLDSLTSITTPTNPFMAAVPLASDLPRTAVSPMKGLQAYTPPMDYGTSYADRETDFTAQFSNKRPRLDNRPSIPFMTHASEHDSRFVTHANEPDSRCGFCTDESNCLCKDQSLVDHQEMQRHGNQVSLPPHDWGRMMADSAKAPSDGLASGPGTCDDCQVNPRQRAWCQRVAQLRGSGSILMSPSRSRTSSIGSGIDPLSSGPSDMNPGRIGCSDTFKLLDGRVPMEGDHMDWVSSLKPLSAHTVRRDILPTLEPQRKYSALELDTASVIATLQQSMGPLVPRRSDGPNADLVRAAEETRRNNTLPR